MIVDLALVAGILALALGVLAARQAFAAVAFFIAYGLLLALAWARLGLLDVALTEAAIGAGLSGVLLLAAARRLASAPAPEDPPSGRVTRGLIGAGCTILACALGTAVLLLPEPPPGLAAEVAANQAATALGNPVASVLMAFRGLDTLLESAVLVLAVICTVALAPDDGWAGPPGAPQPLADGPLALLARLLPPLGIVVAAHIFWIGVDAPGGKFQAAAILAAMWLLPWMAGLVPAPPVGARALRVTVAAGPALFIAVGLLGAIVTGAFLAWPPGFEKPLILLVEVALTLSIAAALALLVMGPRT
ncbi:MnhB domain-containing protein [Roseomonas sp. PWR1]|uniref:MnhB domain-containing protein n=1 Tax=Roseomonas nitratireducens TaxID=2820810 RepID=A0ABS4AXG8_9PROT|nr:MnhB domain-containing protein [Neoroseomonas nitratireducens]